MPQRPSIENTAGRRALIAVFAFTSPLLLWTTAAPAQEYVGRFSVYAGRMFLNSPQVDLFQPGYHFEAGMRLSRRVSVGFDYSRGTGDTALTPDLATDSLQQMIRTYLDPLKAAGVLPPDYVPSLPLSSVTQTFAAGPQFPYRRFNRVTLFIRPSIGAICEEATAKPKDLITQFMVGQIAPEGKKKDWTPFYGVGGGAALNVTKNFSLLVQVDFVHDHLFPDLLRDGRNTLRFSIGPGFQFGGNVPRSNRRWPW